MLLEIFHTGHIQRETKHAKKAAFGFRLVATKLREMIDSGTTSREQSD